MLSLSCLCVGPAPPAHSGPHRYVFLIYHQPQQLDTLNIQNITERQSFKIDSWLEQTFHGSDKEKEKPELVAGNFFYAEHK